MVASSSSNFPLLQRLVLSLHQQLRKLAAQNPQLASAMFSSCFAIRSHCFLHLLLGAAAVGVAFHRPLPQSLGALLAAVRSNCLFRDSAVGAGARSSAGVAVAVGLTVAPQPLCSSVDQLRMRQRRRQCLSNSVLPLVVLVVASIVEALKSSSTVAARPLLFWKLLRSGDSVWVTTPLTTHHSPVINNPTATPTPTTTSVKWARAAQPPSATAQRTTLKLSRVTQLTVRVLHTRIRHRETEL